MKKINSSRVVLALLACLALAASAGCSREKLPTSPSNTASDDSKAQLVMEQNRRGLAENELLRDLIDPYVQVKDGHYVLLPGVEKTGVGADKLQALQDEFVKLNALADQGEISILPDRSMYRTDADQASMSPQSCWRGVISYWWGWKIGLSSDDIRILIAAGKSAFDIIPSSGFILGWVSLYGQVLIEDLKFFNCCICHGSCEVATIYRWAPLTPFLDCQ